MSTATTFVVVAVYDDVPRAREDYAAVEELAMSHEVHLDDAVLLRHRGDGHVEIVRHDPAAMAHGAEGGVIVGALVGILFPPALAGMLFGAAAAGLVGAAAGNLWGGFTRSELHELGSAIDAGQAAIVAIGSEDYAGEVQAAVGGAARILRQASGADRRRLRDIAVGDA